MKIVRNTSLHEAVKKHPALWKQLKDKHGQTKLDSIAKRAEMPKEFETDRGNVN